MSPAPTGPVAPSRTTRENARREQQLRVEVAALRRREQRRVFPARICLGPSPQRGPGHELAWPLREPPDVGLLFDLVDSLHDVLGVPDGTLGREDDCQLWLVRPGVPDLHDLDLRVASVGVRVAAARRAAYAGTGRGPMVVLTRYGWLDPLTGESRRWKRLRLPHP